MSVDTPSETAPPPVPPRRPRWIVPAIVGAVVVLLLAAVAAALFWTLGQRGARPSTPVAATTPATFTARGALQLDDVGPKWKTGSGCAGSGGYDDIQGGAQVVVKDRAGTVLAIGELAAGLVDHHPTIEDAKICLFLFSVFNVPAGQGIYGVEISHRGVVQFNEADLFAGEAQLTLG